jgi:hypothetical protein
MRVPRFWTRGEFRDTDRDGREHIFNAYGWSFESLAGAMEKAVARAKKAFQCFMAGKRRGGRYEYLDFPMREEVVDTVEAGGREVAVITRNHYGALVLNTSSVAFADIDFPRPKSRGFWDAIVSIFSKARRQEKAKAVVEDTVKKVRFWLEDNRGHTLRMYRTQAGLRLLFTDKLYEPGSDETGEVLQGLGSDPLYRKLTEKQECFRARLTPKPWRCDLTDPPNRYPWPDEKEEARYRKWEENYGQVCREYRVCELVEEFGRASGDKEIEAVIQAHDRHACGESAQELA